MSKTQARSPRSYENEQLLLAMLPDVLEQHGFVAITIARQAGMKFVDAEACDGSKVRFWLKQGWTDTKLFSAIQFGFLKDPDPHNLPDMRFTDYVSNVVANAKGRGATHALLVHMVDSRITNFVALLIDDVAEAYRRQIAGWPKRARNTKSPTLWFEDSTGHPDAESVSAVTSLELPLPVIAGRTEAQEGPAGSKKITAVLEVRMLQQVFRQRVGGRCGWKCVVSGVDVAAVLDAAHLPGKDWRRDNGAADGVLIRADLHRLLDKGLAEIRDGRFWLNEKIREGEYAQYHGRTIDA